MYSEIITNGIIKALRDELTAASVYIAMAETTTEDGLKEELLQHSKEEFEHYGKLIHYALKHSIVVNYSIDSSTMNKVPSSTEEILKIVQGLETAAIVDYKQLALEARNNNDLETEQFFIELMKAEQEHFDDLSVFTGKHRTLATSVLANLKIK